VNVQVFVQTRRSRAFNRSPRRIWGLIAALSEFAGGILVVLGFLFRPAATLIALTMLVAFVSTFREHPHNFTQYSRAIEMFSIMIVFIFVGPGKYSFEKG
jgi:putative oxidoreductase